MLASLVLVSLALTPQGPLTYAESSTGLMTPRMEGGTTELEFGDVNNDGHLDIVSVGDHGSPFINTQEHGVMVWFGNGRGQWEVFQYGNFGYGGVALGDVNGDRLMDVGYGVHHNYSRVDLGDQLLEVALGDGTGRSWVAWDDGLATSGETWGMSGTDFADVDNDGDLDVGSNSFGCCAGIHVYLNMGDGTWQQSFGFLGGNSTSQFKFADLDNDGNVDLLAGNSTGRVYFGDGRGGFTKRDAGLPGYSTFDEFGIGDINGDGMLEIATAPGGVRIYGYDPGEQSWRQLPVTGLPGSGSLRAVDLADMDADGTLDVCAFGNGQGVIWRGDGQGGFSPAGEFSGRRGGVEVFNARHDVDHNGRPDILVVVDESATFTSRNTPRLYRESSRPDRPAVDLVQPGRNRVLRGGSVQFIDWYSSVFPNEETQVWLHLSTSGADGPWRLLADGAQNNGRFQWTVPQTPSAACHVRITITSPTFFAQDVGPRFEIR